MESMWKSINTNDEDFVLKVSYSVRFLLLFKKKKKKQY